MESKNKQPWINVGIMSRKVLNFYLDNDYSIDNCKILKKGNYSASVCNGIIRIENQDGIAFESQSPELTPIDDTFFELKDVTIGVNFHWEQNENQQFKGNLKLVCNENNICAVNSIHIEEYLKSVISSEMSATSSPELLKAHSVISRSWLLAQIIKTRSLDNQSNPYQTSFESPTEIIRWYDREDHHFFDVCADDHCQRYQGITKIHSEKALKAVEDTFGRVLTFNSEICDARFYKCCGGITEKFENTWEPVNHPYLTKVLDYKDIYENTHISPELESDAQLWIRSNPAAFCNTSDKTVLSQVLPDFDQATSDFYRWKVSYTQAEISELINSKSGMDFGTIIALDPLQRGVSGRIMKLKITGTKRTLTVGKELEIRKWLSKSHLYSSAFVVDSLNVINGIPQMFTITGAGWGHGVGLCQIGAAVMGEKGYSYTDILHHYFPGSILQKMY